MSGSDLAHAATCPQVHVKKYAEGKARSKVGNAVRRGVSAHEYDDKVDGDEK